MHAEYLLLRPDFNLDDRIKRVPVRMLGERTGIATVVEGPTYRLGLYLSVELDAMLSGNIIKYSYEENKIMYIVSRPSST